MTSLYTHNLPVLLSVSAFYSPKLLIWWMPFLKAHVRGHQVRKNYKKITWSVGIVEKVILRWRRRGNGLRGFKSEAIAESLSMVDASSSNGDDFDFLKEGRKQTEERLQKALARVKSMVQYPEARDQYRRLLNVGNEIQEAQVVRLLND